MDWKQVRTTWSQLKGKARETWGRLTDDDLEVIRGKRDILVGKLREVYGLAKSEAERQAFDFARSAGAAAGRAAGRAKSTGRRSLSVAKKAGRATLGHALDAAGAGIEKVRGMLTNERRTGTPKPKVRRSRPVTPGAGAKGSRRR